MKAWIYKWLPIIFGCHGRVERSFSYREKPFPICARCTGELVGIIAAVFSCFFYRISLVASLVLMVPLVVDGIWQLLTSYESNNAKRCITGILFGYGLVMFVVVTTIWTFQFGARIGRELLR